MLSELSKNQNFSAILLIKKCFKTKITNGLEYLKMLNMIESFLVNYLITKLYLIIMMGFTQRKVNYILTVNILYLLE